MGLFWRAASQSVVWFNCVPWLTRMCCPTLTMSHKSGGEPAVSSLYRRIASYSLPSMRYELVCWWLYFFWKILWEGMRHRFNALEKYRFDRSRYADVFFFSIAFPSSDATNANAEFLALVILCLWPGAHLQVAFRKLFSLCWRTLYPNRRTNELLARSFAYCLHSMAQFWMWVTKCLLYVIWVYWTGFCFWIVFLLFVLYHRNSFAC